MVERYYLKAMNCPHHHRIFAAEPRSYRDLPLRLAEYGTCYRYEQSGELFGLMRVRSLNMNDAHIYCTAEQFAAEFNAVNEMYLKYFKIFGIEKYVMRFSTHDPSRLTGDNAKFVNEPELWKKTEDMVRKVLIDSKIHYVEVPNEAAFYGPKIDVQVWSVIGREFTLATNQVDFAVPAKFGLTYRDRDNIEEDAVVHPSRAARHARAVHRLFDRALRRQFPALARAGTGARADPRRGRNVGRTTPKPSWTNCAETSSAANRISATTRSRRRSPTPKQAKVHTMLVIGGRDMDAGDGFRPPARQRQRRREAEGRSRGGYFGDDQRATGINT